MAIRFDPTVNLGHVLTFFGFMATGLIAWQSMDKRITVLETKEVLQSKAMDTLKFDINQVLQEIKRDVKDIRETQQSQQQQPAQGNRRG